MVIVIVQQQSNRVVLSSFSSFSVQKWKESWNVGGASLTMMFLERLVLIGCNSFLLILVLKVGRNSWKLFHFVMMRCTTLYELHLKIFSLPAWRLVPMFSEQQGKKEFWQSTSQPHPQELIKCSRACGMKKYILTGLVQGKSWRHCPRSCLVFASLRTFTCLSLWETE